MYPIRSENFGSDSIKEVNQVFDPKLRKIQNYKKFYQETKLCELVLPIKTVLVLSNPDVVNFLVNFFVSFNPCRMKTVRLIIFLMIHCEDVTEFSQSLFDGPKTTCKNSETISLFYCSLLPYKDITIFAKFATCNLLCGQNLHWAAYIE